MNEFYRLTLYNLEVHKNSLFTNGISGYLMVDSIFLLFTLGDDLTLKTCLVFQLVSAVLCQPQQSPPFPRILKDLLGFPVGLGCAWPAPAKSAVS